MYWIFFSHHGLMSLSQEDQTFLTCNIVSLWCTTSHKSRISIPDDDDRGAHVSVVSESIIVETNLLVSTVSPDFSVTDQRTNVQLHQLSDQRIQEWHRLSLINSALPGSSVDVSSSVISCRQWHYWHTDFSWFTLIRCDFWDLTRSVPLQIQFRDRLFFFFFSSSSERNFKVTKKKKEDTDANPVHVPNSFNVIKWRCRRHITSPIEIITRQNELGRRPCPSYFHSIIFTLLKIKFPKLSLLVDSQLSDCLIFIGKKKDKSSVDFRASYDVWFSESINKYQHSWEKTLQNCTCS